MVDIYTIDILILKCSIEENMQYLCSTLKKIDMRIYDLKNSKKGSEENQLLVHFDSNQDEIIIVSKKGEAIRITTPSSSEEFEIARVAAPVQKVEIIYPMKI